MGKSPLEDLDRGVKVEHSGTVDHRHMHEHHHVHEIMNQTTDPAADARRGGTGRRGMDAAKKAFNEFFTGADTNVNEP